MQIAAAGRHNILFIGPPGSGKTMLAKRLPTIMPAMTFNEVLETSKIYSITGKLTNQSLITTRPFRSPHHTISQAGLLVVVHIRSRVKLVLAHNGILFLDELTEFKRETLEALRQPLENKTVSISRVTQSVSLSRHHFYLLPHLIHVRVVFWVIKKDNVFVHANKLLNILEKLSGPLLDRIDLQVHVQSIEYDAIKTYC